MVRGHAHLSAPRVVPALGPIAHLAASLQHSNALTSANTAKPAPVSSGLDRSETILNAAVAAILQTHDLLLEKMSLCTILGIKLIYNSSVLDMGYPWENLLACTT